MDAFNFKKNRIENYQSKASFNLMKVYVAVECIVNNETIVVNSVLSIYLNLLSSSEA